MTEQEKEQHWSLDKRVPLAVVAMLGIQACAAIWWASGMASTVASHDKRITAVEAVVKPLDGRLARIEVLLEIIAGRMDRDEARQDRRVP